MKTRKILTILVLGLGLAVWPGKVCEAGPMSTAFTYQGRLMDANDAANGIYDFNFGLYDSASDGNKVGGDVNVADVDVIDGYFTVELDFGGSVFDGNGVWLDIGVRAGELEDPNTYTFLNPRQQVTPTPYALHTRWVLVDETGSHTFVGADAGHSNTTGRGNTFLGHLAGYFNATGSYNTFLGVLAGHSNTTGYYNTYLGERAGATNMTGSNNLAAGHEADFFNVEGSGNTIIGHEAGRGTTFNNKSRNVFIGYQAGYNETGDNKLYIANDSADANVLIYGDFSAGQVGIGTTSPAYDLDVDGDIRAIGSVYYGGTAGNADGTAYTKPDYVFEEGYEVMSTEQVEEYLKGENHLPWMTSAKAEEEENGDVIDMTRMAFETVETAENLQVQVIELNKRVKLLEAENNEMKSRLALIESMLGKSAER